MSLPSALISAVLLIAIPQTQAGMPLPRSTPEAQGVSSQAVCDFVKAEDQINTLHSFMIVRHGQVIGEGWWQPEAADKPHVLNSVSKSFNATAVGLAIEEGKLSLDDHVLKFFPADAPPDPSANLKAMTVRDLLTMTCGHAAEPRIGPGGPSVKQFLAYPVAYTPGTHFQYNTLGAYVLSAIVTKATGQTSLEFLKPRLFEPLGVENPQWDSSPEGNSLGGYGLKLRTEDLAKFGQLYLQKGKWHGRRLIPQKWIEQATSRQVPNDHESHAKMGPDWRQGYGYQFWRCTHNAYRADGAAGQFIVVIPDKDAVIAITADTGNMQGELNAIWDKLYPAFGDKPLPEDAAAQQTLEQVIAHLEAHPAVSAREANTAYQSFIKVYWNPNNNFFRAGEQGQKRANFWFEAQLWDTVMDQYDRTHSPAVQRRINEIYDGFNKVFPDWTANKYNDDIMWWTIACTRAYAITHNERYLKKAKASFDYVYDHFSDDVLGGGIYWTSRRTSKNSCINCPAVIAAVRLSVLLKDPVYLDKAKSLYAWEKKTLTDGTGKVFDNIRLSRIHKSSHIGRGSLTYNQGTYLGGAVLLYQQTGDKTYLEDAIKTADWTRAHLCVGDKRILRNEGQGDAGAFKGIFVRYMKLLIDGAGQRQFLPWMKTNAAVAWHNRRPTDNIMGNNWTAPPHYKIQSQTAASALAVVLDFAGA